MTALIAFAPLWGIMASLRTLAASGAAKISALPMACGTKEIVVAIANVGRKGAVLGNVEFRVVRAPVREGVHRDDRQLVPDGDPARLLKEGDSLIVKYQPSSDSGDLPTKKQSDRCSYELTLIAKGFDTEPSRTTVSCDCPVGL